MPKFELTKEILMYKCQKCGKQTLPNEHGGMIVLEKRLRSYENSEGVSIGKGDEIVKEIHACPDCYRAHEKTLTPVD